jgi:hypothetical protein
MCRDLKIVFKLPFLLALFALWTLWGLWGTMFIICYCGIWLGILWFIGASSWLFYMIVREIRRLDKMKPLSEFWEVSSEKWNRTLEEYAELVKQKVED